MSPQIFMNYYGCFNMNPNIPSFSLLQEVELNSLLLEYGLDIATSF